MPRPLREGVLAGLAAFHGLVKPPEKSQAAAPERRRAGEEHRLKCFARLITVERSLPRF